MKHLFKVILLLLAILLLHASTQAIERRDQWIGPTPIGVLIRDIGNDMSIVCNQFASHTSIRQPCFIMITTGVDSANYIMLDNIDTVYDFEIFGGNVYFCGVKGNYGVLGYFQVAAFPTPPPVQYLNVLSSYRLRQLEVGTMAGQTHMVSIGDGARGTSEIVDAIDLGTSWGINAFDARDSTMVLTDLAITDNYVVVSYYNTVTLPNLPDTKVLYLNKPTAYGTTFNPLNVQWRMAIKYSAISTRIEACEGDAFVVTSISNYNYIGTTNLYVAAFTGLNSYASIKINESVDAQFLRIRDLQYYEDRQVTELLLEFNEEQNHRSVIYNLETYLTMGDTIVYGHLLEDTHLKSLCKNSYLPNHFYTVGINKQYSGYLDKFTYDYEIWDNCSRYISNRTILIEKCYDGDNLDFSIMETEQIPLEKTPSAKNLNIKNKCKPN